MSRTKRSPNRKYNLEMLHGKGYVALEEHKEKHSGNKRHLLRKMKIKVRRKARHKLNSNIDKEDTGE